MACAVTPRSRRLLHALAGRGQGWLLAAAGVLLLVARAFVPAVGQLDTAVLTLAVGLVVLGVVLPTLVEAELGATGLSFKRLVEERDAETERTFSPGFVDSLSRFAVRLAGEHEAVALVEEALARTYADWRLVPAHRRRLHVLCTMVHLALGAVHLDGGERTARPDAASTGGRLVELAPRHRALLLLRHYESLSEDQIAEVMGEPLERTRRELATAELALAGEHAPEVAP
jgi:hypothetical protein